MSTQTLVSRVPETSLPDHVRGRDASLARRAGHRQCRRVSTSSARLDPTLRSARPAARGCGAELFVRTPTPCRARGAPDRRGGARRRAPRPRYRTRRPGFEQERVVAGFGDHPSASAAARGCARSPVARPHAVASFAWPMARWSWPVRSQAERRAKSRIVVARGSARRPSRTPPRPRHPPRHIVRRVRAPSRSRSLLSAGASFARDRRIAAAWGDLAQHLLPRAYRSSAESESSHLYQGGCRASVLSPA